MKGTSLEPNGCGPDGTPEWASNRFFVEECNAHDLNYTNGMSRADADKQFLDGMLQRSDGVWYRVGQAYFHYYAVRLFGWMFYGSEQPKKK